MRKTIAVAGIVTLGGLGGVAPIASAIAASTVSVGDNYFVRQSGKPTVTAKKNQRVTFKFVGRASHNVVVTKGPVKFSSPIKTSGTYKSPKLKKGTYTIVCTIHGAGDQSMTLKVK